jgi:hypothetical protein
MPHTIYTIGYGKWSTDRRAAALVAALKAAVVELLVDIRHSPCSSQTAAGTYGPKPWTLQAEAAGIRPLLAAAEIGYRWVVELGNPQKTDPDMRVLAEHLADAAGGWPVHRGLALVKDIVLGGKVVCLMCACDRYADCHRKLVAEALLGRHLPPGTAHRDLTG